MSLNINNAGVGLEGTNQVTVTSSVTPIVPDNRGRAALLLENAGSATIWVGTASVSPTNGFPIPAGTIIGWPSNSALFAITSGASQTLAYAEFQ